MYRTVFKYPLPPNPTVRGEQTVPPEARPLTVQWQDGRPMLWAEVPELSVAPAARRLFIAVPTGGLIEEGWEYLGTLQDGRFVWHYYWKMA